ncbi:hypothetical protein BDY19DRAFT_989775 [Irpex rosettiformis]|uniref:Uncharacterized protein n=1 Tax=Irpex rosettiformis TaxID=378272 RepID=A0ACB8UFI3_9APHY|nr:hypothetical protein BDY19DRAFT_989775 [Irpex rosettiformis]
MIDLAEEITLRQFLSEEGCCEGFDLRSRNLRSRSYEGRSAAFGSFCNLFDALLRHRRRYHVRLPKQVEKTSLRRHTSSSSHSTSLSEARMTINASSEASLKTAQRDEDQMPVLDLDPDPFASSITLTAHPYDDRAKYRHVVRSRLLSADRSRISLRTSF